MLSMKGLEAQWVGSGVIGYDSLVSVVPRMYVGIVMDILVTSIAPGTHRYQQPPSRNLVGLARWLVPSCRIWLEAPVVLDQPPVQWMFMTEDVVSPEWALSQRSVLFGFLGRLAPAVCTAAIVQSPGFTVKPGGYFSQMLSLEAFRISCAYYVNVSVSPWGSRRRVLG